MYLQVAPNIKNYITWFKDDRLKIEFSGEPKWDTLKYPPLLENPTKEQLKEHNDKIKDIDEKPYICLKDLWVRIAYEGVVSHFFIHKGYRWNGANIPRGCWYLIGNPDDPKFRLASMLHDWLCENHNDARNDRYLSTLILCSLCKVSGVQEWRISLMFHAVDNYQKVFGRDLKGDKWGK